MDLAINNFEVETKKGKKVLSKICQIDTSDIHKSYLIYTDNKEDDNGFTNCYASIFDKTKESISLQRIETDEEWQMLERVLYEMEDKKEEFE